VPTTLNLTGDLAGIATGELVGVSQLSKAAGNEMQDLRGGTLFLSGSTCVSRSHSALQGKGYLG
jgi:hypothetical protein